ncbi:hypothetical protein L208DRAFT_97706 [Tricholoma matsutake]|nr:hypothetical protein L208DRAFT_97706 [Tricholoma matsutake 945]
MIRYAGNPPKVNAETILNKGFPTLGLNSATSPIGGFGISIDPEMAIIPARELPPPRLTYKEGKANVNNGSWNNMVVKFHRGAVVASSWIKVVQDGLRNIEGPQDPKLRALVEGFTTKCRKSGMTMPDGLPRLFTITLSPSKTDPTRANDIENIRTTLKQALQTTRGVRNPGL